MIIAKVGFLRGWVRLLRADYYRYFVVSCCVTFGFGDLWGVLFGFCFCFWFCWVVWILPVVLVKFEILGVSLL